MLKIALAVAATAAVLTTAPVVTPAKAQGVDVQVGRDRDYRYDRDRDYRYDRDRRHDRDTTIGVGPGGVTIGPGRHCRTVTTTVESDDGRMIKHRERRCD